MRSARSRAGITSTTLTLSSLHPLQGQTQLLPKLLMSAALGTSLMLYCAVCLPSLAASTLASNPLAPLSQIDFSQDRDGQTRIYLHSDRVIQHKTLRQNAEHLVLELEAVEPIGTVRANYAKAPHIEGVILRPAGENTLRLEVSGQQLIEPVIGFREAKQWDTRPTVLGAGLPLSSSQSTTANKASSTPAKPTAPETTAVVDLSLVSRFADHLKTWVDTRLSSSAPSTWAPVLGVCTLLLGLFTFIAFKLKRIRAEAAATGLEAHQPVNSALKSHLTPAQATAVAEPGASGASPRFKALAARLEAARNNEFKTVPVAHVQGQEGDGRGEAPIGLGALARSRQQIQPAEANQGAEAPSVSEQTVQTAAQLAQGLSQQKGFSQYAQAVPQPEGTVLQAKKRLKQSMANDAKENLPKAKPAAGKPSPSKTPAHASPEPRIQAFVPRQLKADKPPKAAPSLQAGTRRQSPTAASSAVAGGGANVRKAMSSDKMKNSSPEVLQFLNEVAAHMDRQKA